MVKPWTDDETRQQAVGFTASGYDCRLIRQKTLGYWMGYVLISDRNHPWYGADMAELTDVKVHGGVAYAGPNPFHQEEEPLTDWWVGFYCGHADDLVPYFWEQEGAEHPRLFKGQVYRDVSYARKEVEALAQQAGQYNDSS